MNEFFQTVLTKAHENKALLIKAGSAAVGAVVGAVVATVALASTEEEYEFDQMQEAEDEAVE